MSVSLYVNNKQKIYRVHKLVMLTFIGPVQEGLEIRHLNGNPQDNRLENLKYDTHSENMLDRYRNHKVYTKLSKDEIKEIAYLIIKNGGASFAYQKKLAQKYKVNSRTIRAIRDRLQEKGANYKWLTRELYT